MSFGKDLQHFRLKVDKQSDDLVEAVEVALFSAVINDSPVLTGRFRGNWQTSTSSPLSGTLVDIDKSGQATIGKMASFVGGLSGGRITFLVNNLPYAVPLEYGYSSKAPHGMVRRNVARFQQLVNEELKKL